MFCTKVPHEPPAYHAIVTERYIPTEDDDLLRRIWKLTVQRNVRKATYC